MEETLGEAAENGNVSEVKDILRTNPFLDVNWKNLYWDSNAALHWACGNNHDAVVAILLAHPGIDVNLKNENKASSFWRASQRGNVSCVKLMLWDSRVDLNEANYYDHTPLSMSAYNGHLEIIRWWIASGREMNLGRPGHADSIASAKELDLCHNPDCRRRKHDIANLLERFKENPVETRNGLRIELGWYTEAAAEVFALVVFLSDGLLHVRQRYQSTSPAARFFEIANRLPMELQQVLCRRVVGSGRERIHVNYCEAAFKRLVPLL